MSHEEGTDVEIRADWDDDDRLVVLLRPDPVPDRHEITREAALTCLARSIELNGL